MLHETEIFSFLVRIVMDGKAAETISHIFVQHIQTGEEAQLKDFRELNDFLQRNIELEKRCK